ncbi:MAG: aspartate aminotransferase [Candidatus Endobugula sp.]|jgi:aspartate aminotransferase
MLYHPFCYIGYFMFDTLQLLPADPILNLVVECKADDNPDKVDLGAGVYKDASGHTPIMAAVQAAQTQLQQEETTKTYVSPAGLLGFNQGMISLLLGESHPAINDQRVIGVQAPGGCGALNIAGHLIKRCNQNPQTPATVWISTPTWANHIPLLSSCGLQLREYPYYDDETQGINFDAMMEGLERITAGDVVLLHGCCHNPSGADLTQEQWRTVAALLNEKGAIPFVDVAYQGLGDGLEQDAWGMRYLAEHCPEMIIASSCSKNFGLYRERVGEVVVIAKSPTAAQISHGQLLSIARGIYSMPPNHGAALVDIILHDAVLSQQWQTELTTMRERIAGLRVSLVKQLQAAGAGSRFDYIQHEKGMFSFLGVNPEQVNRLKQEHSIYMVNSSRISVAGLSSNNMQYVVQSLMKVL